jgi:hypothetical protein
VSFAGIFASIAIKTSLKFLSLLALENPYADFPCDVLIHFFKNKKNVLPWQKPQLRDLRKGLRQNPVLHQALPAQDKDPLLQDHPMMMTEDHDPQITPEEVVQKHQLSPHQVVENLQHPLQEDLQAPLQETNQHPLQEDLQAHLQATDQEATRANDKMKMIILKVVV